MTTHLQRIVVTGSECTGKSTLARDLAVRSLALWVSEQSREIAARLGRPLTPEDVSSIASTQIAAEDAIVAEAARRGDRVVYLDTDLLSTIVYSRHYYGACPAWIEAEAHVRLGDLYLLADIDVPWTPDGVRDRPEARQQIHDAFHTTLAEFGARVCEVHGLAEDRTACAIACLRGAGIENE
jgi:nicotinamide riboside kinase